MYLAMIMQNDRKASFNLWSHQMLVVVQVVESLVLVLALGTTPVAPESMLA
jgi:ABC-type histidine transport system ATPase subunit